MWNVFRSIGMLRAFFVNGGIRAIFIQPHVLANFSAKKDKSRCFETEKTGGWYFLAVATSALFLLKSQEFTRPA